MKDVILNWERFRDHYCKHNLTSAQAKEEFGDVIISGTMENFCTRLSKECKQKYCPAMKR